MNGGWLLENVGYCYGDKPVLERVSCAIHKGFFYGIIGPNGSGKTTLMDLLAGIRRPVTGRVECNGRAIALWHARERARQVALVPQEFRGDFGFSVAEMVMMGRHPYLPRFGRPGEEDYARVDAAMKNLDIDDMAQRQVTGLSGGEKQRVVVARALAQDTGYLLLDEATSNLDIRHTLQILGLCRDLTQQEGRTVVAVLHDLNLAAAYCDQLLVLDQGRLVAEGATRAVLTPDLLARVFGVAGRVTHEEGVTRLFFTAALPSRQEETPV